MFSLFQITILSHKQLPLKHCSVWSQPRGPCIAISSRCGLCLASYLCVDCVSERPLEWMTVGHQTLFLSKTVCLKRYSCPRQFVSNVSPVEDSLSQTSFLAKTVCLKRYPCPRQFVSKVIPVEDSLSQTSFLSKTVVSNVIPVQDSLSQTSFLSKTVCLKRHTCPRQFVSNVIPVPDSLKRFTCPRQFVSNVIPDQDSLSQTLYLSNTVCLKRYS